MQGFWAGGSAQRFWEIDFARGVAVAAMIASNAAFDLNYFAGFSSLDYSKGFWWLLARATAAAFLFLVGVGLSISYARRIGWGFNSVASKFLLRGAGLFCFGLVITLFTHLFFSGNATIYFGVLHFIGVAIVLSLLFISNKHLSLLAGIFFLALTPLVEKIAVPQGLSLLFVLGFAYNVPFSPDFFPLFPWLGVVLLGVFAGKTLYAGGNRNFAFRPSPHNAAAEFVCRVGRHSLLVYFLHQPVIVGALYLLGLT